MVAPSALGQLNHWFTPKNNADCVVHGTRRRVAFTLTFQRLFTLLPVVRGRSKAPAEMPGPRRKWKRRSGVRFSKTSYSINMQRAGTFHRASLPVTPSRSPELFFPTSAASSIRAPGSLRVLEESEWYRSSLSQHASLFLCSRGVNLSPAGPESTV